MVEIPGFWDVGPHDPLPVEATWHRFVRATEGTVVDDLVTSPKSFENADFLWNYSGVVAELKEIQTEFTRTSAWNKGFEDLLSRLVVEEPGWRPALFGGRGGYPLWFRQEFVRLARPPIGRILKKANVQIRETKAHFNVSSPTGVLFLVNDGFSELEPGFVMSVACDLLAHSYSSIDCLVYLTVNRYVEIRGSNEPGLLWHPAYSSRADDSLVEFIDGLGRRWFDFLEQEIGPFTSRTETEDPNLLRGARAIRIPDGQGD